MGAVKNAQFEKGYNAWKEGSLDPWAWSGTENFTKDFGVSVEQGVRGEESGMDI